MEGRIFGRFEDNGVTVKCLREEEEEDPVEEGNAMFEDEALTSIVMKLFRFATTVDRGGSKFPGEHTLSLLLNLATRG